MRRKRVPQSNNAALLEHNCNEGLYQQTPCKVKDKEREDSPGDCQVGSYLQSRLLKTVSKIENTMSIRRIGQSRCSDGL
jgi:hypothetical protein